ncbi:hypothetical protein [Streptomyces yanii]|uniref:hypothetical protein n=1 Tax=Streptomyces yanii TaxID=78510 RepID=UPI0031EC916F
MPISLRASTTGSMNRIVPASRNAVVPPLEHLQRRELGGDVLVLLGVVRVDRCEPLEDVLQERGVVRDETARERFAGDVHMRIDQPPG